ncbi:MAG: glycogen synthase GlgA [Spirochaetes bacterium]|nr:glycogen synthase GlgA [Spirochaetota bacterium]
MKIAFATSEAYPFAKTGGLADVSSALPAALARRGHDVRIIMPRYYAVDRERYGLRVVGGPLGVPLGGGEKWAAILESRHIPEVPVYFIEHEFYFGRDGLYDDGYSAYADNAERFIFFCRGVMQALKDIGFAPDIIHCNDWQTGLIPVYHKTLYRDDPFFNRGSTVMTVHNAGYQGVFPAENYRLTQLDPGLFTDNGLEFFNQMNFLKGGVLFADAVTTVSRKYADELSTPEFGYDLADVFQKVKGRFRGITNGVDYSSWNPETDPFIPARYSRKTTDGKRACREALQQTMGIDVDPAAVLAGTISRVTYQKGMDVLADALRPLLADENLQFVLLGQGDERILDRFGELKRLFPGRVGLFRGYDERLSHLIEAGLDIYLMPSRYEPCGLNQMYSMRYGTIPVVRATGGLDDTVIEWDDKSLRGNGFKFAELTEKALYEKIRYVIRCYHDTQSWKVLQRNAMEFSYSWSDASVEYERMYEVILLASRTRGESRAPGNDHSRGSRGKKRVKSNA